MKTEHTGTIETVTGTVSASVKVDYHVPKKGDVINVFGKDHTLTEDMTPRVECTYDGEKYVGNVMTTTEGTNRVVFFGDGLTWRQGENYRIQSQ